MITAKDLNFQLTFSMSADKEHSLLYADKKHNVKMEIITSGRTVGGMFRPKEQKTYFYRNIKGSTVHESVECLLKELNT